MTDIYRYTGDRELTFVAYGEVVTGPDGQPTVTTLNAVPGDEYEIYCTDPTLPIPPDDVNWEKADGRRKTPQKPSTETDEPAGSEDDTDSKE